MQTLDLAENEVAVQTLEPYIEFASNPRLQEIKQEYERRISELEEDLDDITTEKTSLTREFDLTL